MVFGNQDIWWLITFAYIPYPFVLRNLQRVCKWFKNIVDGIKKERLCAFSKDDTIIPLIAGGLNLNISFDVLINRYNSFSKKFTYSLYEECLQYVVNMKENSDSHKVQTSENCDVKSVHGDPSFFEFIRRGCLYEGLTISRRNGTTISMIAFLKLIAELFGSTSECIKFFFVVEGDGIRITTKNLMERLFGSCKNVRVYVLNKRHIPSSSTIGTNEKEIIFFDVHAKKRDLDKQEELTRRKLRKSPRLRFPLIFYIVRDYNNRTYMNNRPFVLALRRKIWENFLSFKCSVASIHTKKRKFHQIKK